MTPKEAIAKLMDRNWTISQIASEVGMHRANVYKAYNDQATPRFDKAISIINLAKSGRVPPKAKAGAA